MQDCALHENIRWGKAGGLLHGGSDWVEEGSG